MATLGNYEEELGEDIKFAVTRVLHNWARPLDERDDLVQEVWQWYLARPSTQAIVANRTHRTGRRNIFYKGAQQILSAQQDKDAMFHKDVVYSSDAVRDWLLGDSTNKYLGKMIQVGLDKLSDEYREVIRDRFERGNIPKQGAENARMVRALRTLTEYTNAAFGESQETDPKKKRASSVQADKRRAEGGYNDPTAKLAFAMISAGDQPIELQDGGTTTMRELFEEETLVAGPGTTGGHVEWLDLFEGEINDRTDMYRAQVFPELYPNEKPMLVENWHPEDRAAFVGGEYTEGYRRLRVVK
jgi:hypothetical protein